GLAASPPKPTAATPTPAPSSDEPSYPHRDGRAHLRAGRSGPQRAALFSLSPIGGEGWGEGARFSGLLLTLLFPFSPNFKPGALNLEPGRRWKRLQLNLECGVLNGLF